MNILFFLIFVFSILLLIGGIVFFCQAKKQGTKYFAIVMLTLASVFFIICAVIFVAHSRNSPTIPHSDVPISITKPSCNIDSTYGHTYFNGTCSNCGAKDPDFFDPENYGFQNNYGMTLWIEITAYSLSTDSAEYEEYGYQHKIIEFKNNVAYDYTRYETHNYDKEFELSSVDNYTIINNDTINKDGHTYTIFERKYDSDGHLILKVMHDSYERWYVLSDQIDWDRSPVKSGTEDYHNTFTYYFK